VRDFNLLSNDEIYEILSSGALSRDILSRVCRDAKLGKISEKSVEVLSFR
jgi:hypothetical protein